MVQLPAVEFLDGRVQFPEDPEPFRRDACFYDAPVFFFARARDQSPRFHAVEQSCNVRIARDHSAADLAAGEAFRPRTAKDAQDVVLCRGKSGRLQQRLASPGQDIGCTEQVDEDLLFQARFRSSNFLSDCAFLAHAGIIVVVTTIVKRNIWPPDVSPCTPRLFPVASVTRFSDLTQRGGAATKSVKIIYRQVLSLGATFLRGLQRIRGLVVQRTRRKATENTEGAGIASHGFCVGRICTSLMKLPGA